MEENERYEIPSYDDAALRKFVLGMCDGKIFVSAEIQEADINKLGLIFLPLAYGGGKVNWDSLGVLWEWRSERLPMTVNGYPQFASVRMMNDKDWHRAKNAIMKEMKRREEIEL